MSRSRPVTIASHQPSSGLSWASTRWPASILLQSSGTPRASAADFPSMASTSWACSDGATNGTTALPVAWMLPWGRRAAISARAGDVTLTALRCRAWAALVARSACSLSGGLRLDPRLIDEIQLGGKCSRSNLVKYTAGIPETKMEVSMTSQLNNLVRETKRGIEEVRIRDKEVRRSEKQWRRAENKKAVALRNYLIQILNKARGLEKLTKGHPKLKRKLMSAIGVKVRKSQKQNWIRFLIWQTSGWDSRMKSKYYGFAKFIDAEKPKGTKLRDFWNKGNIRDRAQLWARKQKRTTPQPKASPRVKDDKRQIRPGLTRPSPSLPIFLHPRGRSGEG